MVGVKRKMKGEEKRKSHVVTEYSETNHIGNKRRIPVWLYVLSLTLLFLLLLWNVPAVLFPIRNRLTPAIPSTAGMLVVLLVFVLNAVFSRITKKEAVLAQWHSLMLYGSIFTGIWVSAGTAIPYLIINAVRFQRNAVIYRLPNAQPIMEKLNSLMFPKTEEAIAGFWLGKTTVPWGEWIWPIIMWSIFALSIFFIWYFALMLVQNYWVEKQKFRYPIAETTLIITDFSAEGGRQPFWSQKTAWIGLFIGILLALPSLLHSYFPVFPEVLTGEGEIRFYELLSEGPWKNIAVTYPGRLHGYLKPYSSWYILGFGYLAPTSIAFSIWFFYLATYVWNVIGHSLGYWAIRAETIRNHADIRYTAAFFALGVVSLYLAREDVKLILKKALGTKGMEQTRDSENEFMGCKTAVIGFIISVVIFLFISVGFLMAGITYAIWWLLLGIGIIVGAARLRTEAGLPVRSAHGVWGLPPLAFFGQAGMGRENVLYRGLMYNIGAFELSTLPIIFQEQYFIGDKLNVHRKSITRLLWINIVFALIVGFVIALPLIYDKGGFAMRGHYNQLSFRIDDAAAIMTKQPLNWWVLFHSLVGVGGVVFLSAMTSNFTWWPFHPLGFVLAPTYIGMIFWLPMFVVWSIKVLVMKYGGYSLFKKTLPIVYGFIAGDLLIQILAVVLGYIFVP
jgi:hypothetical protein